MPPSSGFIRHFIACNTHDPAHFVPFSIGNKAYGLVKKDSAEFLSASTKLFEPRNGGLELLPRFADFSSRSEALMEATKALCGHIGKPLRNEFYPILENWDDEPLAQLDRVAVPWFGVRARGIHVNGFVRKKDGLYLWVGERAKNRQIEPGKLDNMIGGGLPIGLSLDENLCKEAKEEAGISPALARTAKPVGCVNYKLELPDGLRADTLYLYDFELPEDFAPKNTDGEVAAFHLMPLAEVTDIIRNTDRFKFNCAIIIVDFMMRMGFLMDDREYSELAKWQEKSRK